MRDEKIEELEKLVQDLKHNWKLALADADNIKKIAMRGSKLGCVFFSSFLNRR